MSLGTSTVETDAATAWADILGTGGSEASGCAVVLMANHHLGGIDAAEAAIKNVTVTPLLHPSC